MYSECRWTVRLYWRQLPLGAGLLAGLATDFYKSTTAVAQARSIEKTFHPQIDESQRQQRLDQWRDAVGRCRGWARSG